MSCLNVEVNQLFNLYNFLQIFVYVLFFLFIFLTQINKEDKIINTLHEASKKANLYFSNQWVKWIHEGSAPAYTHSEKQANAVSGTLGKHCAICLNLNGCCFTIDNKPKQPVHEYCHCRYQSIPTINATSDCPIAKFTEYIFDNNKNNGKKVMFEAWGYNIEDSEELKSEFEKQAKQNYELGEYSLGVLDKYGQRINIEITLLNQNTKEIVTFYSGWMVYPDGKITLNTPYGRKII